MEVLSWCSLSVRRLAVIAFPCRDRADEPATARALRWCLHLLLWTSLLAGLWYLNRSIGMERSLRSPWPSLHRAWLPLLVVPIYLAGWLSVGLWTALRREMVASWPDIDEAWEDARKALASANIDIAQTPVFLILGPLPRELQTPLESLGASPLPLRGDAPFRVFAHAQAIYLVCDRLARLGAHAQPDVAIPSRLQHLCQLVLRARAPRPPIQGIVLSVPFAATQTDADTKKAAHACQDDLRDLRQATGLEVPLYLAISGFDPLPNMQAAETLPAWFQRFPPLPDLDPAEIMAMYHQGVDWLCLKQIPRTVHAQLQLDPPPRQALWNNIQLYQWLSGLQAWRTRLEKLLVEGMQNDQSEPGLVAGCYLAPTGLSDPHAVELTRTLCADLQANRETVTWTAETVAQDANQRRRTWLGFGFGLLGLVAMLAAIGVLVVWRP